MFVSSFKTLKIARTGVYFFMFIVLGFMASISGPTLLDLAQSSNSGESISFIFPARSSGYLFGSIVGGFVLDKIESDELALVVSSLFVALGAYAIPWARSLTVILGIFTVTGFAMGFSNTGSNSSCLRIWGKTGAPILQGLHFCFGFGACLAPLLAAPFLSTPEIIPTMNPILDNVTQIFFSESSTRSSNLSNIFDDETSVPTITYVYIIVGMMATMVCGSFAGVFLFTPAKKTTSKTEKEDIVGDPGFEFTIIAVSLACLLTGLVSGIETAFTQMLTLYVVESHGLPKSLGSYMTSVYWGTYTSTRFVSVFLTYRFDVKKILMFDLVLTVAATTVLMTIGSWSVDGLWVGTGMLGIGIASIFPGILSLVEKYVNINSRIACAFTLVSCVLEMIVPRTISVYLATQPNILFQFMTTAAVSVSILFIVLIIILNRKGEKHQLPLKDNQESTKQEEICFV